MATSSNQQTKLLYVMRMLLENTDENHVLSMNEILSKLAANGIEAERKSIYDDIEVLNNFGMDIVCRRERPAGYYVASREFELPELKLLVDAVQSSKFITTRKSTELIKKLEKLSSNNQAKQLQRQVVVSNRIKTMNESIYYTVDDLHQAISSNKKITFQYCEWSAEKKLVPKKSGQLYNISPYVLNWDDENYYLIGYDNKDKKEKYYRVDKIRNIKILDEAREGKELFDNFNSAEFSKKTFGMFDGRETDITLEYKEKLVGVILDRFGTDIPVREVKEGILKSRVKVNVSSQFFGWLTGLGDGISIKAPEDVAKEYKKYLKNILKNY